MSLGGAGGHSVLGANYLTVVSVYSLLLLSEVVFLEFVRLRPFRGADLFSGAGAVLAGVDRQESERAVFHRHRDFGDHGGVRDLRACR